MFFKIAFRNLLKRKVFAFINISGLALGLAACLMIYLYITDELDYDNFYPDGNRIVRIVRQHGEGGQKSASATVNYKLGALIRQNISQVQKLAQLSNRVEIKVGQKDQIFTEDKAHYADNEFLEIFGISFVHGNKNAALKNPFEVVLTKQTAEKIFGNENGLGQSLNIDDRDYLVVGVVEPLPDNAHLHFDYLLSIESTKSFYSEQMFEHWGNIWIYTYALLGEGLNTAGFENQLASLVEKNGPPVLKDFGVRFYTQAVEDIHLHSQLSPEF